MITLNDQLLYSMDRLNAMEDYFVLKGYAGTGKTTVITHWVESLPPRKSVVLTAPTNKATNVLRDKARELNLPVEVSTIHSLLSLKMKWEKDKQILVKDSRGDDQFADYDYVVIDECGMLDTELMGHICRAQGSAGNRVIFMGDPCQLPPINEKESRSFNAPDSTELTDVVRQADGSNIVRLATYLRNEILSDAPSYPNKIFEFVDDKSVYYHPLAKYQDEILEAFSEEGERDIRHVAWTNKVVDSWNNKIRDKIYGFDREDWMEGEQIVTTAPVIDPFEEGVLFSTDTLLEIDREPTRVEKLGVTCWKLFCSGHFLYVVSAESEADFRAEKERLLTEAKTQKGKWQAFYKFMETFAHIKPAHSLTVHRSQGSTFDDTYVSFANILTNPRRKESLQCLYVACTRPRSRLFLV